MSWTIDKIVIDSEIQGEGAPSVVFTMHLEGEVEPMSIRLDAGSTDVLICSLISARLGTFPKCHEGIGHYLDAITGGVQLMVERHE